MYLFIIIFLLFSFPVAYADNNSSSDSSEAQDQQSFPFDNQCLKYDKDNFKVGTALLDIMKTGDFPQYCVLYSLSNYQVKQKNDDEGYFIIGSKLDPKQAETSIVVLKSNKVYQQNQTLAGNESGDSKPVGQWVYFVGPERFETGNGQEKELYVFQEIDF